MSDPVLAATRLTAPAPHRPLLVLGSSLGTAHLLWSQVVPLLGDAYEVVAVDHPGHGPSPAVAEPVDVAGLARALLAAVDGTTGDPVRPFTYAGVSLGGAVGLQLLLDAPERVAAALVACSGARIGEPAGWHERAALVRAEGMAAVVDGSRQRWFAADFPTREPDVVAGLLAGLTDVDAESYARCCEALAGFDVRDRLGEVAARVLVLSGSEDPVCPPDVGAVVAAGVPHAHQHVLPGVGHLAPAEDPRVVAEGLLGLLPSSPDGPSYDDGMAVRRAVLGDAHVDRATAHADATTRDFQELITRYAWGGIWTRPGLDRRTRSLVTITALVAGHHWQELELHLRAAVENNGVSRAEVVETLLQTAVYCSVPSANTAFGIAQKLFDRLDGRTDA